MSKSYLKIKLRRPFYGSLLLLGIGLVCQPALSFELSFDVQGRLSFETQRFLDTGLYQQQTEYSLGTVFETELYAEPEIEGSYNWGVTFAPFYRHDVIDSSRTHGDIRKASIDWYGDSLELGFGWKQVFWGTTNTQNLVNVINPADGLEGGAGLGGTKLGLLMANALFFTDFGQVELYLMPVFREQDFAGEESRLRLGFRFEEDEARYEDGDEDRNLDVGIRWTHDIGDFTVGISYFKGTNRQPTFVPVFTQENLTLEQQLAFAQIEDQCSADPECTDAFVPILEAYFEANPSDLQAIEGGIAVRDLSNLALDQLIALAPLYETFGQAGIEVAWLVAGSTFTLEAIYREKGTDLRGNEGPYAAAVTGWEYGWSNLFDSVWDLRLIVEYHWDERGDIATSLFEDDLALIYFLNLNNLSNTAIILALFQDLTGGGTIMNLGTSYNLNSFWKLSFNATMFFSDEESPLLETVLEEFAGQDFFDEGLSTDEVRENLDNDILLGDFKDEDFIQVQLEYFW